AEIVRWRGDNQVNGVVGQLRQDFKTIAADYPVDEAVKRRRRGSVLGSFRAVGSESAAFFGCFVLHFWTAEFSAATQTHPILKFHHRTTFQTTHLHLLINPT
ncbi:MAG: hypothetical protein DRP82_03565, partial [Planctomycetota bacterium]